MTTEYQTAIRNNGHSAAILPDIIKAYINYQVFVYNKRPSEVHISAESEEYPLDFTDFLYGYLAGLPKREAF